MNIQSLTIGTKRFFFGLLTISALGVLVLPARADEAVIQDSVQEAIQTGEGNTTILNSTQESRINRNSRGRYSRQEQGSTGVVQRTGQYCDQAGFDNLCVQNSEQRSNIRQNRRGQNRRSRF